METSMELSKLKDKVCKESDIFEEILNLDGKNILELGCGKAQMTRLIATNGTAEQSPQQKWMKSSTVKIP